MVPFFFHPNLKFECNYYFRCLKTRTIGVSNSHNRLLVLWQLYIYR
ncbi:hypothetical protein MtrunA17_Chr1g0168101 [Medicago truncatula]|uniref:Uncharacterized protein n=1 Tax=Medicago truncatula TaxID=3880 RepID=A0A396JVB7_MEDTR|nr:hypothetical protein MtrunA17_Chr1g0168101 [Medicago truncatula]